ncbi:hypothetical protein KGM_209454 [Danaus plexippus plexippus]|uniref:Uncharacterized protein n=1 Tax=Danaus plexippus plexippus TaxID=278856 RepID=A0A212F664_DANPL|nr:hypothetical protein KGM_209454 [Danaus plexippus plexippus]
MMKEKDSGYVEDENLFDSRRPGELGDVTRDDVFTTDSRMFTNTYSNIPTAFRKITMNPPSQQFVIKF